MDKRTVCVKPYPQFSPLFGMDGLREEEGCFYVEEEGEEARSEGRAAATPDPRGRRARARIELEGVIEVEMAPAPERAVIRRLVRVLQWFFGS